MREVAEKLDDFARAMLHPGSEAGGVTRPLLHPVVAAADPEQDGIAPVAGRNHVIAGAAHDPVETAEIGQGPVGVIEAEFGRGPDDPVVPVRAERQAS